MDQLCDSRLFEQEAGFEPANLFRSECYLGLFPHCFASTVYSYLFEREAGYDPTTTTWQAVVLPTILFSQLLNQYGIRTHDFFREKEMTYPLVKPDFFI
jgi:hypothetical protein